MDENTEQAFQRILGVDKIPQKVITAYTEYKFCFDKIGSGGQVNPQILALIAFIYGKDLVGFPVKEEEHIKEELPSKSISKLIRNKTVIPAT